MDWLTKWVTSWLILGWLSYWLTRWLTEWRFFFTTLDCAINLEAPDTKPFGLRLKHWYPIFGDFESLIKLYRSKIIMLKYKPFQPAWNRTYFVLWFFASELNFTAGDWFCWYRRLLWEDSGFVRKWTGNLFLSKALLVSTVIAAVMYPACVRIVWIFANVLCECSRK